MKFLRCLLVLGLMGLSACASKPPKNAAILRLHLPASPALPESRRVQAVLRTPALSLQVNLIPVLTERDLEKAELTGEGDYFALRLTFNTHGTIELDRVSLNNRGEMLIVFINGVPVAAPVLRQEIMDGVFEFTPDMTREEAEKIVAGLNATAQYLQKRPH